MGSTSVNDVGNLLAGLNASVQAQMANRISSNVSANTSSNSPSFESILNAGMAQGGNEIAEPVKSSDNSEVKNKPSFDQKDNSDRIAGEDKREAGKTSRTDEKQDKVSEDEDEKLTDERTVAGDNVSDEEMIENAEEVLATVASTLLEQVAEILQITPEEAENLLNEMGMTAEDLLNSENLSAFALQAMGAEDSLALLTDESKYEQFQKITETLGEVLESDSNVEAMSVEELRDFVEEIKSDEADFDKQLKSAVDETDNTDAGITTNAAETKISTENVVKPGRENDANEGDGNNAQNGAANFAQAPTAAPVMATENPVSIPIADTQQIADQILDYIKTNVKDDTQTLEMQLNPASLGNIQISLTNKDGNVSASFVAQNEQVRAAIENQMIQLQQRFEEQGIKVTSIEVSVSTNSFSENLEQQGHREEEQEAQRPRRVRRLQFSPGMDIPEVMNEEEKLAAEMLAASGGTMDLQA